MTLAIWRKLRKRSEIIEVNRKMSIYVKNVLKIMRKFAVTVLNNVWRVILPKSARHSEKRDGAEERSQSSFSSLGESQHCINCQKRNEKILKSCAKYGVVKYCRERRQMKHYRNRQKICDGIFFFQKICEYGSIPGYLDTKRTR